MAKNNKVVAEEDVNVNNSAILGTYQGECADSNITNLNGLDITYDVWDTVFKSDEYKKAIELGHYIGYLGHPADPDCQDFEHACIVMTEGHIDDNGKVYGTFNLIDTPVGRIVKAFQDAGVTFGISVRGAGDIINNSVDPETFVFRGFDLVTFPAFPESIPEFVAASTDMKKRKQYQAVCAAVKENMDSLSTIESVEMIQSCFAPQSEEYKELEEHKQKIQECVDTTCDGTSTCGDDVLVAGEVEFEDPRVASMTKLYLETAERCKALEVENSELKSCIDSLNSENARKMSSIERIFTSQMNDLNKTLERVEASLDIKTQKVAKLEKIVASKNTKIREMSDDMNRINRSLSAIKSSVSSKDQRISELESQIESTTERNRNRISKIQASLSSLRQENRELKAEIQDNSNLLEDSKKENLKYIQKVEAAQKVIKERDSQISSLSNQLDETVRKHSVEAKKTSNFDEKMNSMQSKITAAEDSLRSYQDAYSKLYANALGISLPGLRVTASTSVNDLQNMIRESASLPMKPDILEPTQDMLASSFDVSDYDDDDLVTL